MIVSMGGQALLFLGTVAVGAAIGLMYDAFRIVRKAVRHPAWLVQAEDVLYWVSVVLVMFGFLQSYAFGEIRFFAIAGAVLGQVLYFNTASPLIMRAATAIIAFVGRVLTVLFRPFRWLFRKLTPPARKLARFVRRRARNAKRNLFVIRKKV